MGSDSLFKSFQGSITRGGGGVGGLERGLIRRRLGGVEELFILVSSVQRSYSVEGMEQFFF